MPKSNFQDENSSVIFPKISTIPEKMQLHRSRSEIIAEIENDPVTSHAFHYKLSPESQEAFLAFCMGNRGLQITYDPFFKNIFNPDTHPGRLDMLLSSIMNQPVTVKHVLSSGHIALSEESSLMLMDMLVETGDGALINVEMQKLGYRFPVERAFCYASDILVRQYDRMRRQLGKKFSYKEIKPVYIIVLMEKSPCEFNNINGKYIHHSNMIFDSDLRLNDLTKFIFISLDNFLNMRHNVIINKEEHLTNDELSMLDAWLLLFSSDRPEDIYSILEKDPVFGEIYRDIINFQFNPKELMSMYSETLRIMDQNTIKFMIDELKEEYDALKSEHTALQTETDALQTKKDTLQTEKDTLQSENEALQSENETLQSENETLQSENETLQSENEALRAKIAELEADANSDFIK